MTGLGISLADRLISVPFRQSLNPLLGIQRLGFGKPDLVFAPWGTVGLATDNSITQIIVYRTSNPQSLQKSTNF